MDRHRLPRPALELEEALALLTRVLRREQAAGAGERTITYRLDAEGRFTKLEHTTKAERVF